MRNYLKFNENWNDNNIVDNINKLYSYIKKDYINHENKLKKYKNYIKDENEYFYKITNSINQDFQNKLNANNINLNNLSQQYKDIIIQTDTLYNNKINELNNKIGHHHIKNNVFVEILKTIYKYLKLYIMNTLKVKKIFYKNKGENQKNKQLNKLFVYENMLNNNIKNSIENILYTQSGKNMSKKNKLENELHQNNNMYQNNIGNLTRKINKISHIIENNKSVIQNLKENINKSTNIDATKMLELLYNNSVNNNILLEKKLKEYLIKINQSTGVIENNIKNNIKNKINVLVLNKKNIKLDKIKDLIDKFKKFNR